MRKQFKTKRVTREHRGVKYWQWPHQNHEWLFPWGKGTAEGIRAFIDRLPTEKREYLIQRSAEMVADLDTPTEAA